MVAETLNECANVQSIKERPGERRLNDEKKKNKFATERKKQPCPRLSIAPVNCMMIVQVLH
jgi:hypothetical protein